MATDKVTRKGLLEYAEWCRQWAQLGEFPEHLDMSKCGCWAQLFVLERTDEGGREKEELLSCALVAESLAYYGDF